MEHVPFKHKRTTLERAEKFISEHYFTDINLRNRVYPAKAPLKELKHCAVQDRIPYRDVLNGKYSFSPCAVGDSFGPVWSTHWFALTISIPPAWKGKEVHLLWNSLSEALVFVQGEPMQGLSGDNGRTSFPLCSCATELEFTIYLEMVCNTRFGIGCGATQREEDANKLYTISQAEIGLFDRDIHELILDVEVLHDIAKELPDTNQRGFQALYTVNNMINTIDFEDRSTLEVAKGLAKKFFSQKNGDSQHTLYAMGHAHIDTAWLWPYAETIRKCARSWSCSLRLMEKYPDFKFMCSQAVQYDWVKINYPSIWKTICKFVQTRQFVPVGGTWVEMDGNIPSGESCIRQFLYGQQFFMKEFGIKCKEFWLPDTFGYSAQFPQILRHCGVDRFLTQKLSWSIVNKFPHHTFFWEGIDGSKVLAHFPPGDSYEMDGRVRELLKSVQNFQDKGRSNHSMFLFGYGDGGNGPSEEMLERLERMKDCDGLPKVVHSTSDEFFSAVERENSGMLCRWRGELYLELHNGTYTTWAQVKKYNRKCEVWLRDLELLATLACQRNPSYQYPWIQLDRLWKLLLLNQFHDVLPGTSITLVYKDAIAYYKDIEQVVNREIHRAANACVLNSGGPSGEGDKETYVVNTQPFPRREIIDLERRFEKDDEIPPEVEEHNIPNDFIQIEVEVPPLSVTPLSACEVNRVKPKVEINPPLEPEDVYLKREEVAEFGEVFVMSNGIIKTYIDFSGRILSLKRFDKATNRWTKEAVDPKFPMNQFVLYDDVPLYWDAWDIMDYHLETRKPLNTLEMMANDTNKLRGVVEILLKINEDNYIKQDLILDAGSPYLRVKVKATWNMNRKCLKVEFPTTVHATEASYDIQSGFLRRPNHYNTSWDSARYEVCGHKWADLSEHGFGVSVMNDCKYGWAAVDGVLRMSLLRSPKNPDPQADIGVHRFSYAIMPHFGSFQEARTIQHALAFNNPLRTVLAPPQVSTNPSPGAAVVGQGEWLHLDSDQVILQAVKMAEDCGKTIILRVHEAFGGCTQVKITTGLQLASVQACDGLEEVLKEENVQEGVSWEWKDSQGTISLNLSPFQIVSLRCQLS
ncbi:alpha-mannosidase 2C1 [Aplysia californica]|uniref:alpha-mannosidase n=1 Tax=Aplysia californica TaxID=6500 RepID=A0ABM0JB34_APLCA|nr:alpha-mannosidase 2C1 [Aplysia californica]